MARWPWTRAVEPDSEKASWEEVSLTAALGMPPPDSGTDDTDPSLGYYMDTIGLNPIVYACIRELSTSMSEPHWRAVIQQPNGDLEDTAGPLAAILQAPNLHQSWGDFIETGVASLLTTGNAYLFLERVGRGGPNARVGSMWWLRADRMAVIPGTGPESIGGIAGYTYSTDGDAAPIPVTDVGHLKFPNMTTGAKVSELYGISPLAVLKNDTVLDALLSDLSSNFLKRGAIPSGLLKLRKRLSSQEDAETVRRRWRSAFSGRDGQWNVAVLDDDASYEQLQTLPKDLALEQTRDEVAARICSVLQIPPIIVGAHLGIKRSTYSNYSQAVRAYHTESVAPLADRFVQFFNRTIVPNFSGAAIIHCDFSAAPSWQEDQTIRAERAQLLYSTGVISLNEARGILNLDTVPGGDIRLSASNVFEVNVTDVAPVRELVAAPDRTKTPRIPPAPGPIIDRGEYAPIPRAAELIQATRRREQEAIDDLAKRLRAKYFGPLRSRVAGITGRHLDAPVDRTKEWPFDVRDLVPDGLKDELRGVLDSSIRVTMVNTFTDLADSGILPTAEFSDRNRFVRRAEANAAINADEIHDTTKKGVARTLRYGLDEGLTLRELVNGDGSQFRGLRAVLTDMEQTRVNMIARTEVARTTNLATIAYYDEANIERVQAVDGDQYDAVCAARNGTVYTLQDASNEVDHPNGTLDWIPVLPPIQLSADWSHLVTTLDTRIKENEVSS